MRNDQGLPHDLGMLRLSQGNPAQALAHSNLLASPFAEMAAMMGVEVVAMDKDVRLVRPDREHPVLLGCLGCVSRWPPASSCSFKSRIADLQRLHQDALTALLSQPAAVRLPLEVPRPPLQFHALPPLPPLHRDDQALGLAQELVDSAGLDGLTGMTARNWKRCGVNHLRSSVKRSTSSAKTMMP